MRHYLKDTGDENEKKYLDDYCRRLKLRKLLKKRNPGLQLLIPFFAWHIGEWDNVLVIYEIKFLTSINFSELYLSAVTS